MGNLKTILAKVGPTVGAIVGAALANYLSSDKIEARGYQKGYNVAQVEIEARGYQKGYNAAQVSNVRVLDSTQNVTTKAIMLTLQDGTTNTIIYSSLENRAFITTRFPLGDFREYIPTEEKQSPFRPISGASQ
jgi:hypothetical protein